MLTYPRGLSSQAIAYPGAPPHHPWDPSDLRRCMDYCEGRLTTDDLRTRMTGRSAEWDRLLPEWEYLTGLLRHEMATRTDGKAPRTYREMKRIIHGGVSCAICDGSGRGETCAACKGTGRRSGGRCRADRCYSGADYCHTCRGNGYITTKEE